MPTYGQILQELDDVMMKRAFIPSPSSQQGQQPQDGQGQGGQGQGGQGQDPTQQAEMQQFAQQIQQAQGQQGQGQQGQGQQPGQPQQGQPGQQSDQQHTSHGHHGQHGQQGTPGGDLTPKDMPASLKETAVTVTVADLLDLVSGGKASQAHLKTESMKVQHGFKHREMLQKEQDKQQQNEMKKQQQAQMQAQQQQGMMGGGIYSGGPMDGSKAPAQPGQPAPKTLGGI